MAKLLKGSKPGKDDPNTPEIVSYTKLIPICGTIGLFLGCGAWNWLGLWDRSWWQIALAVILMGGLFARWIWKASDSNDPTDLKGWAFLIIKLSLISGLTAVLMMYGVSALFNQPLTTTGRAATIQAGVLLSVATAVLLTLGAIRRSRASHHSNA